MCHGGSALYLEWALWTGWHFGLEKVLAARLLTACPRSLSPSCLESRSGAEARHSRHGWSSPHPHRRGGGVQGVMLRSLLQVPGDLQPPDGHSG